MKIFCLALFFVIANTVSASADSCFSFYKQSNRQFNFVDRQRTELVAKSNALKHDLLRGQANQVYDFVGIGAGPTMGSFTSAVRNKFGHLKTLVAEATNNFGTFDRVGNFKSNSIDFEYFRSNVLVGSPVQPFYFDPQQGVFIQAKAIGDATLSMYSYSETNLLLSAKIVNVSEAPYGERWPARYKIDFADGTYVFAKKIGLGTGLGQEAIRLEESGRKAYAEERELAQKENRISKLRTMEEVLERSKTVPMENDFQKNESIVIVGGSDGASIALEALAGLGHYSNAAVKVNEVTVIGSNRTRIASFKKFLNSLRYAKNEKRAGNEFQFARQQGRVTDVVRMADGRFELIIESDQGKQTKIADHVIFANGYENSALQILKGLDVDGLGTQPVFGKKNTTIAQQVVSNQGEHDIYIFGVAGSDRTLDAVDVAKRGPFGSFLRLHGERAAELATQLWRSLESDREWLGQGSIKRVSFRSDKMPSANTKLDPDRYIYLALELGKLLRQFRVSERKSFEFTIWPNLDFDFSGSGLSNRSVALLYKAIKANPNLIRLIMAGNSRVSVTIPVDADGFLVMEKMRLK